jgi:hypothetical protein
LVLFRGWVNCLFPAVIRLIGLTGLWRMAHPSDSPGSRK